MAQTGFTPIQIYSSSTTGNTPAAGNLLNSSAGSELAINIFDGKLFYKDNTGAVQVIGWKVVPVSAGGTGQTSYTDGQLLIGNSTGNTLTKATLTAGSGVSITNGAGAITISATGGTGTVTSITAGTGLTGGTITTSGTIAIDSTVATLTGTQTLTNKTLTSPKANEILDTNGNESVVFLPTTSATDYFVMKNGIGVGAPLHIYADGSSANTGMHIQPKGTGLVTISDGTDFNKGIRFRSSSSAASAVTLLDAVSSAGRVVTLPDATTTLVGRDTTDTLTNKSISGSTNTLSNIGNASLTNSAITINGVSTSLGGSIAVGTVTSVGGTGAVNGITLTGTVTSSGSLTLGGTLSGIGNSQLTNSTISGVALGGSLFNLTAGTGVSFSAGTTYNGSAAITINATGSGGTVTSVAALTLGTTGTDLSSTVANGTTTPVITLNVPTASAANRGALSAADWTTFNGKQAALVSGTNIKTVSGVSLLGSGDVGTIGTAYGGTGLTSFTSGGVVYASSTSALTTGSALVFNGTNLGIGATPSVWNSGYKTLEFTWGAFSSENSTVGQALVTTNAYNTGTATAPTWKYKSNGYATAYIQNASTAGHQWFTSAANASGAGAAVTFTECMRIDSSGIVSMPAYGAGAATFSAAGVISSVSDETWKIKDGVPLNPDAMLQKLEPGYWFYNEEKAPTFGTDRQLGFYAQNVNEAIGVEAAPIPEEGKPWGYYDRSVLAVTVMSLQKALATIENLTNRLEALEKK